MKTKTEEENEKFRELITDITRYCNDGIKHCNIKIASLSNQENDNSASISYYEGCKRELEHILEKCYNDVKHVHDCNEILPVF